MLPKDLLQEDYIEPETITQLFPGMNTIEKEKLQVLIVLKTTRAVYEDMDAFENACLVLSNISPDTDKMEGCLPEHIWKLIKYIKRLYPEIELSDDVKSYIKFIFNDNGLYFYPEGIGIENPFLQDIKTLALEGPFPLEIDTLYGIQAMKYLKLNQESR